MNLNDLHLAVVRNWTADKGSFLWKDLLHLSDKFRGVGSCFVGNGTTVLFWLD